jgi:glycosyltransferase involved in cell wall biosynthesis
MTFLYKGFKKVLKEVSPSVVHIQYMAPGSLSVLLFRFLGVKNIIATAHVPGHIYKRKIIPQLLTKYFLKAFICVSKSSEKDFFEKEPKLYRDELYTQGRKHFTIYNCTETNVNIKKQEKDYINIGIVSRLSHEKGIDIAIKTMKYIIKKYPSAKLTIVGDGGKKEELQALTKKLKLSSYISFEGLQPKEKLESYYNSFDFVFVPSRFEGFGLTAIEAMSYGIPVIASSADGLKEVIEDNISGLLVKTSDPKDYANEIMKLLDDTTYKAIISKNAQQRVIDNFSFETFEKQTISLYNNITKGQN